jgi:hypothetical protein
VGSAFAVTRAISGTPAAESCIASSRASASQTEIRTRSCPSNQIVRI